MVGAFKGKGMMHFFSYEDRSFRALTFPSLPEKRDGKRGWALVLKNGSAFKDEDGDDNKHATEPDLGTKMCLS